MAIKAGQRALRAVDDVCQLGAADAGTATAVITTSADWNGTLVFENSTNGVNFPSCNGFLEAADTLQRTWTTANVTATFVLGCSGRAIVRVRCSVYVAGTAVVTMLAGAGSQAFVLIAPLPAGVQEIGSVRIRPKPGTFTDRSGTITAGGAAQTMMSANTDRRYLLIQNTHPSEDLWLGFGVAAVIASPSILLVPKFGLTLAGSSIATESISVIAATTGHPWTAKEML